MTNISISEATVKSFQARAVVRMSPAEPGGKAEVSGCEAEQYLSDEVPNNSPTLRLHI